MKQKLILVTVSTVIVLLLLGIAKLYISYNLSYYAGYYVQQLPRKEGTNPEMALLLENLDFGPNVEVDGITYDTDGNGSIHKDGLYVSFGSVYEEYYLFDTKNNCKFAYKKDGSFAYFSDNLYTLDKKNNEKYRIEGQKYLDAIMRPILEAHPTPSINLQWLFNQKYEKRFN